MVNFFGHVFVGCLSERRTSLSASGVAVFFVSSRGTFLDLWHGVSRLLGLGSLKGTWGRRGGRCCFRRSVDVGLTQA